MRNASTVRTRIGRTAVRRVEWDARVIQNGLVRSALILKNKFCAEFTERHMRSSQIILAFEIDPVRIILKITNFVKCYSI